MLPNNYWRELPSGEQVAISAKPGWMDGRIWQKAGVENGPAELPRNKEWRMKGYGSQTMLGLGELLDCELGAEVGPRWEW